MQEISTQAGHFEFFSNRPIPAWLRSAKMLLKQAEMSKQDGDLQLAYLYLYRHAQLILARIPDHPDAKNPLYKRDLAEARKAVHSNLPRLEEWKPRIAQEHIRYVKAIERRNAERQRVQQERETNRSSASEPDRRRQSLDSNDSAYDDRSQTLDANENRQLAVDLAEREIRRRDADRSTRRAGISPGTVATRRRGVIIDPYGDAKTAEEADNAGVRETGRLLQNPQERRDIDPQAGRRSTTHQSYQYPAVPVRHDRINWEMPSLQPAQSSLTNMPPPAVPAKHFDVDARPFGAAPALPPKPSHQAVPSPSSRPPATQRQSKYTFKPSAFTEAGAPLRTVLLPPELRRTFLNIAHTNTSRNLETCGILCGTLVSNALFINHLIIPDQKSTSDTCDTTEEGDNELFDYCDNADLLVCGWIHTHPSQSCFLSSRDLHTSSGYQIMLPEAIAIVCAPRQNPDWGIFRLTDPPGLQAVLECRQAGLFHPHAETNLYTDALRPGHVVEGPGLKFEVVDLRRS